MAKITINPRLNIFKSFLKTDTEQVLRGGVTAFLNNQNEAFNIKMTSIYTAFKQENAFKDIPTEQHEGIMAP